MIIILTAAGYLLARRAGEVSRSREEARQLRDDSHETSLLFKAKSRELMERQNYEIRLATLNERGRIAREIHDQVGHLLSRSLLQIGALMVQNRNKQAGRDLSTIRETLSQAMDRIRSSVHNLHDESLELETRVETLVKEFTFCPISLHYGLEGEPQSEIAYCLLAVIKEGLNNILRHSNASKVTLSLLEHPALYQLVLQDNGSAPAEAAPGKGLGLRSMAHRVEELGGRLQVEKSGGFRLFISIPKRRTSDARADSR